MAKNWSQSPARLGGYMKSGRWVCTFEHRYLFFESTFPSNTFIPEFDIQKTSESINLACVHFVFTAL